MSATSSQNNSISNPQLENPINSITLSDNNNNIIPDNTRIAGEKVSKNLRNNKNSKSIKSKPPNRKRKKLENDSEEYDTTLEEIKDGDHRLKGTTPVFHFFLKDHKASIIQSLKDQNHSISAPYITKQASMLWKSLTNEQKQPYQDLYKTKRKTTINNISTDNKNIQNNNNNNENNFSEEEYINSNKEKDKIDQENIHTKNSLYSSNNNINNKITIPIKGNNNNNSNNNTVCDRYNEGNMIIKTLKLQELHLMRELAEEHVKSGNILAARALLNNVNEIPPLCIQ